MEQHKIIPFYKAYANTPAYTNTPAYENMPAYANTPAFNMSPYFMPGGMQGGFSGNMSYGVPFYMMRDTDIEEDIRYLQEIFPQVSRRYAAKIASVIDRIDYKGSMIYDEYPDRLRLQRLSRDIRIMIEKEEAEERAKKSAADDAHRNADSAEGGRGGMGDADASVQETTRQPMDTAGKEELIYVLLCYEIVKRRHGSGRDLSCFYGKSGF